MEAPVVVALFVAVNAAALGWYGVWRANKSTKSFDSLKIEINHRMDELLELTRTSSHAEGVKEEKDKVREGQITDQTTKDVKEISYGDHR